MNTIPVRVALIVGSLILFSPLKLRADPPELRALQIKFEIQLDEGVLNSYNTALGKLNASYLTGVERELAGAKSSGDLETALSLEAEQQRLYNDEALPANDEKTAKSLRKLRGIYRSELAKLDGQRAAGQASLLAPHIASLKKLETELTKADRLADAKAVMDYRVSIATGGAIKTNLAAASPPVPRTNAPASPLSSTTPPVLAAIPAGSIIVAAEIKAKNSALGVAVDAITFDGPAGDGRRGAKGVLLRNDPLTGKSGTTWAFRYTRQGTAQGIQIIHPHRAGQVIVHLRQAEVGVSTPESWTETGYGSGDTKRVKNGRGFSEIFPLKDNEVYEVTSKLDSQGGYELIINGKLVATSRVSKTSPLSFEIKPDMAFPSAGRGIKLEFSGNDFPMRWEAGYAALLVGPIDNGVNACRDVRFVKAVK